MSIETESKVLVALGNVVNSLIRQAEQHHKSVGTMMTQGETATREVATAALEYRALSNSLPAKVKKAIGEELNDAADRAADRLADKFTTADEAAVRAAKRYENAAKGWKPKLIAMLTIGWIGTLGIALLVGWYMSAKTYELKRQNEAFQALVSVLNSSPQATSSVALCGIERGNQFLCTGSPGGQGANKLKFLTSWPVVENKQ